MYVYSVIVQLWITSIQMIVFNWNSSKEVII